MQIVRVATVVLLASAAPGRAQDVAAGERVFGQCRACHQIGPGARNALGPPQNGLFGRRAGTYPGYSYSPANRESGLTWDEATFRAYIRDPRAKMPGTKMVYPGLKNDGQITDLIAFLKQFDQDGNKVAN